MGRGGGGVTVGWRKLRNVEVQVYYASPNVYLGDQIKKKLCTCPTSVWWPMVSRVEARTYCEAYRVVTSELLCAIRKQHLQRRWKKPSF